MTATTEQTELAPKADQPTPSELTQQTVRFATKRENLAKWVYSLKTSKAREKYDEGAHKTWTKVIETLDLIPETTRGKAHPDDREALQALAFLLEVCMAVHEQVEENFYASIAEAETELQLTLAKIQ